MTAATRCRRFATALALCLALGAPAGAVDLVGKTEARFQWTESTGLADYYLVYVSRDAATREVEFLRLEPAVTVTGSEGETIQVWIQAGNQDGLRSDFSLASEPVTFLADSSGGGGAGTDPPVEEPPVEEPPVEEPPVEEPPVEEPPVEEPPVEEPPVEEPPVEEPPVADATVPMDFNGDGIADLLVRDGNQLVVWTIGNGAKTGELGSVSLAPSEEVVGNADYDGDGFADLLTHDPGSQQIALRLLQDGQPVEAAGFDLATGWEVVASADFDGDGTPDIAVRHAASDLTELWSMVGIEIREVVELPEAPPDTSAAGAGDFDGDGRAELLWHGRKGALLAWYFDDAGTISEQMLGTTGWNSAARGICDFDRDGRSDLLIQDVYSGDLRAFQSAENFRASSVTLVSSRYEDNYRAVSAGDFDGDGDCDIAQANLSGTRMLDVHRVDYLSSRSSSDLLMMDKVVVGVGSENPAAHE